MTLDQLRYFIAAAKFEHINRAAQSIPISASVISQSVMHLEEELNCKLFLRDKKRIRLTQQGVRLLELSGALLGQADTIKKELGKTDLPLSGHYRIGGSHFLAMKVLAPVWTAMQGQFPELTVDVHSQPTWSLVDSVLAGRLDFAIGFSPVPHPQLEMEEIFRGESQVVARKDHPIFARAKKNTYRLLNEYPATMHIATEKIFMARHHPFFKTAHLEKNITFSFDNDFVALENLQTSENWCLMLDVVAAEFHKSLRVIPLPQKSEAHYTIQLIRHKSRKADAVMLEAYDRIKERVGKLKKHE